MISPRLELELLLWRLAGRRARLWWRDDDAAGACPALARLLAISAETATPLCLAVIPAGDMAGLAQMLAQAGRVCVVQHGVDHQNRREGAAAGEFAHDWPQARLAADLALGWARVAGLPRVLKVFAPPWNDVHPALEAALRDRGFVGWSAEGGLDDAEGLPRQDVHVDLLRWRGGARFRGRGRFLADVRRELSRRRRARAWDAPIGLLTHHLAHDAAAWSFLEYFLRWSRGVRSWRGWTSRRCCQGRSRRRLSRCARCGWAGPEPGWPGPGRGS